MSIQTLFQQDIEEKKESGFYAKQNALIEMASIDPPYAREMEEYTRRKKEELAFYKWVMNNKEMKILNCIRPAYCLCKACQFK